MPFDLKMELAVAVIEVVLGELGSPDCIWVLMLSNGNIAAQKAIPARPPEVKSEREVGICSKDSNRGLIAS